MSRCPDCGMKECCGASMSDEIECLRDYAGRYKWIRENPAWETEAFLSGLTPKEYDSEIDKRISQLTPKL